MHHKDSDKSIKHITIVEKFNDHSISCLYFDGAYKGNPGKDGYGGFFRFSTNIILRIFYGSLGIESNTVVELACLLQNICLTFNHDLFPLIVERDSQLILDMATRN